MHFPSVEAAGVAEQSVLAELFAMVRRDDEHGVLQDPLPIQVRDELTELSIHVGDAVVVRVAQVRSRLLRAVVCRRPRTRSGANNLREGVWLFDQNAPHIHRASHRGMCVEEVRKRKAGRPFC